MSRIILEKMQFYAYHGCFAEEQLIGTNFEVTLTIEVDTTKASKTDTLEDALNYQEVFTVVKAEMGIKSKLIEHVAQRIVNKLLITFPQIKEVTLTLSKLNPPLGGQIERVSIEISKMKNVE